MLGSLRRRLAFVVAAALASCTGVAPTAAAQPKIVQAPADASKPGKRTLFTDMPLYSSARHGRKGAGVSMAQQKRTATKKRGVARNRRNHR
jgi:hypothetical protein